MEREINVGLHNRFDIIKRDAKTGDIINEYFAENIMLNQFWTRFFTNFINTIFNNIHFGSGTATPLATDTSLTTFVGAKAASNAVYNYDNFVSNGVVSIKKSCRLEDTEYNGNFISEVGISDATSSSSLRTKALVKDMNGNTVSIEKKAGEILDIYATVYVSVHPYHNNDLISIAPNSYILDHMLFKTVWQTNYSKTCVYMQCAPQRHTAMVIDTISAYNIQESLAHDIANKKITLTIPNVVAANGNIAGGIRGLSVLGISIKVPCTGFTQPVLTKEVVGIGDGIKKDFQTSFGYILNNSTAKVYVNDIEQTTGVTIDYDQMHPSSNIANNLKIVSWVNDGGSPPTALKSVYEFGGPTKSELVFENPFYQKIGMSSMRIRNGILKASNDLTTWETVGEGTSPITISAAYKNHRYWKVSSYNNTSAWGLDQITSTEAANLKNIHFDTAPAIGDTVSVTYQPDCIAKDTSHVLNNVKVVVQFNEYTPT